MFVCILHFSVEVLTRFDLKNLPYHQRRVFSIPRPSWRSHDVSGLEVPSEENGEWIWMVSVGTSEYLLEWLSGLIVNRVLCVFLVPCFCCCFPCNCIVVSSLQTFHTFFLTHGFWINDMVVWRFSCCSSKKSWT